MFRELLFLTIQIYLKKEKSYLSDKSLLLTGWVSEQINHDWGSEACLITSATSNNTRN